MSSPGQDLAAQAADQLRELAEVLSGGSTADDRWTHRLIEPYVGNEKLGELIGIRGCPSGLEALDELPGVSDC